MKKYYAVCWLIIGLSAVSCTYSTPIPDKTPEATVIPRSSLPSFNHSFRSRWEMVDQISSDDNDLPIIVYAMKLTGQNTIIISSVVSDKIDVLGQPNFTFKMKDNIGDAELISKSDLVSPGNVNFLVMEFEARQIGASEIFLLIEQSISDANYLRQIARFVEPPEDPAVFSRRTYLLGVTLQNIVERSNIITFKTS